MSAELRGESDVLIVGAGPAGAAAAIALARAGVDVVVLDRARFPRDKTCGDALSGGAVELLDELGAGAELRAGAHALVRRGAAVFPDGTRVERSYDRPGFIVPRLALDDCIRRAAERAGARVVQGTRVAHLIEREGAVCGADGPGLAWRARIVIAADGYGSVGLAPLERPAARGRYLGVSATLYARGVRFPFGAEVADHLFERDLAYGYAWVFPEVEGVANLGVYQRQDVYRRSGRALAALLEAFVARHPERFGSMVRASKVRSWSLPLAPVPRRASGPGLLLAGDAGGFVDPLSGEGIWQALFTGVTAGTIAAEAVQGPGALTPELCRRYEQMCAQRVVRPSRGKALAQTAIHWVVAGGLYRLPPVQLGLEFAYGRRFLEMTGKT